MGHDLVVRVLIWSRAAHVFVLELEEKMDNVSWGPYGGFVELEAVCVMCGA